MHRERPLAKSAQTSHRFLWSRIPVLFVAFISESAPRNAVDILYLNILPFGGLVAFDDDVKLHCPAMGPTKQNPVKAPIATTAP